MIFCSPKSDYRPMHFIIHYKYFAKMFHLSHSSHWVLGSKPTPPNINRLKSVQWKDLRSLKLHPLPWIPTDTLPNAMIENRFGYGMIHMIAYLKKNKIGNWFYMKRWEVNILVMHLSENSFFFFFLFLQKATEEQTSRYVVLMGFSFFSVFFFLFYLII